MFRVTLKELGSLWEIKNPLPNYPLVLPLPLPPSSPHPALVWAFWITGRAEENNPIVFIQAREAEPCSSLCSGTRHMETARFGLELLCYLLSIFRAQVPILFLCDPWFFAPLVPYVSPPTPSLLVTGEVCCEP